MNDDYQTRRIDRSAGWTGFLALVLAGAACTNRVPDLADPSRYDLALSTVSPLQPGSRVGQSVVDGALRFAAPESLLNYDARYALRPALAADDAALPDGNPGAAPAQLLTGTETLQQSLQMRLPFLFAQPLLISADDSTRGLLTPAATASTRTARLQWSPATVALGLRWTAVDTLAAALPLNCQLSGSIELPGSLLTGRNGDGLKLQGRGCRAVAPERGLAGVDVSSYSATWQWQRKHSSSSVHLLMLEPAARPEANALARAQGYEFGASRAQTLGALSASSSMALRHASNTANGREQLDWTANASLRRQFSDLLLSLSLQREADPLWFLPDEAAVTSVSSVELGIAFDRWIARQLATPKVGLGLVGRWTELPTADQAHDYRVLWNFTLRP